MLLDYCLGRMREAAMDAAHLIRGTPNAGPLDVPRWVNLLTLAAGLEREATRGVPVWSLPRRL